MANQFRDRVREMGISEVLTAPQGPRQNEVSEEEIYCQESRPHLSLSKDAPSTPRRATGRGLGRLWRIPRVGALHHRYERRTA